MSCRILPLVLAAALAVCGAVPSPESHFGHKIGADRTVLDWDRVVSYFHALEHGSDRIQVQEYGKSAEGRQLIAAFIAAPATLRSLERYRGIQNRLADPRATPENEAARLAETGKAVVMITCSVHATEIAATHAAVEYAYRLATANDRKSLAILDNVVFILVPSLNPDGVDLVTKWYRKTLETPFEGTTPPELYQKYTGHDNNRDWYFFTQAETRATVSQLHNRWHPQIVYDVHQQGPNASRFFVPPWVDPIDPNIDPILAQTCNMIGTGMAMDLTAAGKTGVVINAMYDFWTPARHYQAYHGGLRILSEAASAKLASPTTVTRDQISQAAIGYRPRERSWNYLEPWLGGEWRLRDIIDYELIAMESVLYQAATRRADMLRNFYKIGQRAASRISPWAFVIPATQQDAGAAQRLLETLAFGSVEVERATEPMGEYPAGSYVIRMQQPYSSFAKTLLERQQYPDLREYPGGPPKRPYDVTAHTLPLLMGVKVAAIDRPPSAKLERAAAFRFDGPPDGNTALWAELHKAGRVALYRSWPPNMDEGWTRWVLEDQKIPYQTVRNAELQAGNLRARFDTIVFAEQSSNAIANGYRAGAMPDEYAGGVGPKGAQALKDFAQEGGTLVFLNTACEYAVEHLGLKLKNVVQGISNRDFYLPGSLLNAKLDTSNALAAGTPANIAVWGEDSPAWDIPAGSPARVVARYTESGVLASGWLLGEKHIAGKAALLEYPMGKGRAVLFGFRPQYRAQSWQTFKLFFNALEAKR
jgi:hypothetical protein